jgi:hypothetical protein
MLDQWAVSSIKNQASLSAISQEPPMSDSNASHEPHPWADKTPDDVLRALVYELYTPVSALGDQIDRLSTGAFEDEELTALLDQMREGVDHLSRLVVLIKRYTAEHGA